LTTRRKYFIFIALVVAVLSYFTYDAMKGAAVYYLTVTEAVGQSSDQDTVIRVNGKLVQASFVRGADRIESHFDVTDDISIMTAHFSGVLPDLFFNPHSEIILEGSIGADQVFQADNILVKCPSKYRSLEEEQPTTS